MGAVILAGIFAASILGSASVLLPEQFDAPVPSQCQTFEKMHDVNRFGHSHVAFCRAWFHDHRRKEEAPHG